MGRRPYRGRSPRAPRQLRYLPTSLSAPQIAGELYLSHNTVRTHMRHLYAKLGTHRRADTVARARALGLWPILCPAAGRVPKSMPCLGS